MWAYADVLLNACRDIGLAVNVGKTNYMEVLDGTTVEN